MTRENKEQEDEQVYSLVEVPTETGIFIKDNKNNRVLDDKTALVEILNKIDEIQKAVA